MGNRLLPVVLTTLTALTLATTATGCDPNTLGDSAALPDPCVLITAADLETQLGESFQSSSPAVAPTDREVCDYDAFETGDHVGVSVYRGADAYKNLLATAKSAAEPPTILTGIGVAAFRTHSQLYAAFSNFVFAIELVGVPAGDNIDAGLEALGRTANSRITGDTQAPSSPSDAPSSPTA